MSKTTSEIEFSDIFKQSYVVSTFSEKCFLKNPPTSEEEKTVGVPDPPF